MQMLKIKNKVEMLLYYPESNEDITFNNCSYLPVNLSLLSLKHQWV